MRIIATAGHVDHGKSTLVRTLTGIEPDRWEEERRRGLTIDLGFAHMRLPNGEHLSFIDVPGHIRFISNMLAGVGGVHACLLVVDAREGWMPQTEEHLRILEFVGIRLGVIALTKTDVCTLDEQDLATVDVERHVHGTFLQGAPIVPVSSASGAGLDVLVAALTRVASESSPSHDRGRPRLFIDRVFAPRGSGTVVTGTLIDGSLAVGSTVTITPSFRSARIRAIQSLGRECQSIGPGHRVALNLSGIDHRSIERGNAVIVPDQWFVSDRLDARLGVLHSLDHPVTRRGAYTVHIGSDEIPARLRVLGSEHIPPGGSSDIRLHLDRGVPVLPGDRFVLRESGRSETVGGGEILDIDPVLSAAQARPDRSIERVLAERAVVSIDEFRLLTGLDAPATTGRWILSPAESAARTAAIVDSVDRAGPDGLDVATLDEIDRSLLADLGELRIEDGRVRRIETQDPLASHPAIARLEQQRCAPEDCTDITRPELRRLAKSGIVFESEGHWFHQVALEDARSAARALLEANPDGFTVSQLRERLGITRKHAVPLASAMDARGITRRRGDVRIAGPRL